MGEVGEAQRRARSRTVPPARADGEDAASGDSADVTGDADSEDGAAQQGGELLRRARDLLLERLEPLPAAELAHHMFGSGGGPRGAATAWAGLVDQLLRTSSIFARDAEGCWRLAAWDAAARTLDDAEFVVLDVETTGLAPGRHRVIEIGAVIVRGGEITANFRSFVHPGRHIPQFISKFTGISNAMVARAPQAAKVLPKLRAFIGDRPIVGHNIGFDLNFLNYEADRCGLSPAFATEGIDTIALARRYLTGMRRAGLDRVAAALHVPVGTRHRALPDAHVTAQVFLLLLARAREEGCRTLEDLFRVLDGVAPVPTSLPAPRPSGAMYLNPAWRQKFPTQPGVYLMKDAAGEVIYVGKAKCLRDRLSSYYSQPLGYTRKMDGLLQSVTAIETRTLGSELEALLVESQLIKQLQPRYNVQLRNYEHYPFIKVDVQHAYPRFYATREVAADGARYFGPFRSGRVVNATLELIAKVFPIRTCTRSLPPSAPPSDPCLRYHVKRCPAPCRGVLSESAEQAYRRAVEEACAFLGGERSDLIDRLKRQMFAAAAQQDFERAARLRDALRDADQVLLGQRLVTGAVEANNLIIAYPSAEPEQIELFLVRHGRLARLRRVPLDATAVAAEVHAMARAAATLGPPPARVGRAEVDQINIIARWIHHHSDDDSRAFFRLPPDLTDTLAIEALTHSIVEVVTAPSVPAAPEMADDGVPEDASGSAPAISNPGDATTRIPEQAP